MRRLEFWFCVAAIGAIIFAITGCGAVKEAADLVQWDNSQGHH